MATTVQLEEGNGLLPPLRELFLEIQVNKLINDYLFSTNADARCTSLRNGASDCKENQACFLQPGQLLAMDAFQRSACNAPCLKSANVLDDHHMLSLQDSQSFCTPATTLNQQLLMQTQGSRSEDEGINRNAQLLPHNSQTFQALNGGHEVGFVSLCVENDGRKSQKTAYLSRVDTFPCTSKAQSQAGAPCKVDTEVKASCKKPPRPPSRFPKSELGHPILSRCSSDNGAYFQSSRRAKAERRRKAAASAGANTSTWALLFTLFFATIMIAQGFWSQGNQSFENGASSPVETVTKGSMEGPAVDISLVGVEDGQASTDGIPAQSYVMRKVHPQYLSDMEKHLKPDAFPNP